MKSTKSITDLNLKHLFTRTVVLLATITSCHCKEAAACFFNTSDCSDSLEAVSSDTNECEKMS